MAETDPRVSAWRQGVRRLAQLRSLESCLPFLARPTKSTGVKVAAHCLKPRCKSDASSWVQNPHYLSHADSNGKLELWRHLVKCDWTKDKNVKHVAGCDAGLIRVPGVTRRLFMLCQQPPPSFRASFFCFWLGTIWDFPEVCILNKTQMI